MDTNSNIRIKFGKHKGTMLKDVPLPYLRWCLNNNTLKGRALSYAKFRLNLPKDTYQVKVEDSIGSDGTYTVKAYSKYEAIRLCQKKYRIQSTQSFCGTTFYATKL